MDFKESKKRVTKNDKKSKRQIYSAKHVRNQLKQNEILYTMAPYTPPVAHYSQMDVSMYDDASSSHHRKLEKFTGLLRSWDWTTMVRQET